MTLQRSFGVAAIYVACLASCVLLSLQLLHGHRLFADQQEESPERTAPRKPYFALSTNRTFGTQENAKVFITYQSIDSLDFRVYRVKDPVAFFAQLANPHRMGERDEEEVAETYPTSPTILEHIRAFKTSISSPVRSYLRDELKRSTRTAVLQKFRGPEDEVAARVPLNIADYARVPLLNADQVVATWRERLKPLESDYDTRMIPLGKRESGVYLIEAVNGTLRAYTIAVVTDLATVDKIGPDGDMLVYAVNRQSGAPREGIEVDVTKSGRSVAHGTTDGRGILNTHIAHDNPAPQANDAGDQGDEGDEGMMEEEMGDEGNSGYQIMARDHHDFSISDLDYYAFSGGAGVLTSYIYSDRPVYRPGQTVYFKGILRVRGMNDYEAPAERTVAVTVEDPKNSHIFEKQLSLSARGTFSGEVHVAEGAPLGNYRITAQVDGEQAHSYFELLEYKKPEYKVQVSAAKPFVSVGENTKFTIDARYFFGEPVANADVEYYIYRSRYYHSWWRTEGDRDDLVGEAEEDNEGESYGYGNDMVSEGKAKLGADGKVDVAFTVPASTDDEPWDYTYRLEAQVTDASRSVIEGRASFVGTRGSVVMDARPERWVYYQGDSARITIRSADYQGRPVAANATLTIVKQWWEITQTGQSRFDWNYTKHETELASAEVSTNARGEGQFVFRVTELGDLDIKLIVHDGAKRIPSYGGSLWVVDGSNRWENFSSEDSRSITLVADKRSYQPGETAHVLAMLPEDNTHLLVTTELMGVKSVRQIDAVARAVMIDVPIDATCTPNVYLSVGYVKDGDFYSSEKMLGVPARARMLSLEITSNKNEYRPGETATYTVAAHNADGTPAAGAEVSVGVVDESIYSIRPDGAGDIRRAFYGRRYDHIRTIFTTSYSFIGHSGTASMHLAARRKAYQLADFKNERQYAEPTIRKLFKDTAFWLPDAMTGADGTATVKVALPDNLTTWRTTARAVTADLRVGSAIEKVIARKNLILRLETPRFMTEGDVVTCSAVVHNYLNSTKETKIALTVTGATVLDPPVSTVTIARQGEARVDWRVSAAQVGQVVLLAKALTDEESDAVELPLPIVPHGLQQTRGSVVTLTDDDAEQTITLDLPADAHTLARSFRLEAAPSIAATLFGSLDYLTAFPYGCTEQTMSSFLPNVIVTQALREINTSSIRPTNDLALKVQRGMDRLYGFQHHDGGWGWWKDDRTDAFMTSYVVDGLLLAKNAGYQVDTDRVARGRSKLRQMVELNQTENGKPIDDETQAYMIYALVESAEFDSRHDAAFDALRLKSLYDGRSTLKPYGLSLLALSLHRHGDNTRAAEVADELQARASTNEYEAHWESSRRPMLDFAEENDLEATALSLKALALITPKSSLLPKIARWLVANRRNGACWESTKHTAFAIFGLTEYLKVSRELAPDYTLEMYVNGQQVASHRMTRADAKSSRSVVIERTGTNVATTNRIRIVKRGRGVAYVSGTLAYFTMGDRLESQSAGGLSITREYQQLRVTQQNGKTAWSVEPFNGDVRSGDLIVSRLTIKGGAAQYMMVEDPIPAGCEQVERVSGIDLSYASDGWCNWYSDREFRDQKTAFFLDYFSGSAVFKYALRVITPGEFRIPPARVELMYRPVVQANTSNARLKIFDKK